MYPQLQKLRRRLSIGHLLPISVTFESSLVETKNFELTARITIYTHFLNTLFVSTLYFCNLFQEVSQLASSLYTTGTNLSRSVSSAGEQKSEAYVSPILPKRAETFGGFDATNQGPLKNLGKKLSSGTPAGTPDENIKPGDSRLFVRNFQFFYVL